jgi:hypothetical protein
MASLSNLISVREEDESQEEIPQEEDLEGLVQMKPNNKAGVPIGTIVIIIIVIIASLGMWWYFTMSGPTYPDVRHQCDAVHYETGRCDHHGYTMRNVGSHHFVKIEWWEGSHQWRVKAYVESNDGITTFIWHDNADDLNEWFQDHGAFSGQQKTDMNRMVKAAKAGCPGCEEI